MKKSLIIGCVLYTISAFGQQTEQDSTKQKIPFEDIDMTWANGNDRRTESTFSDLKYFVPSVMIDINYTYSFNNPNDNTVVGSTALTRNNEITLSALHFGGDFTYKNARARFMTQFGTRSIVVPRNDVSPYKGQYQLANVYRYLSEAYAGYHFDKWYGINISRDENCSLCGHVESLATDSTYLESLEAMGSGDFSGLSLDDIPSENE